jgi:virginiamycin B lyase
LASSAYAQPASITVTEIPLTTPCCPGGGITVGPSSDFWLVAGSGVVDARRNGSGFFFPLPQVGGAAASALDIARGPDGNLWVTDYVGKRILRLDPSDPAVVTSFPLPSAGATPGAIVVGPDGNLWFTESTDKIGRITTAGEITEFPTPTPSSEPARICVGSDGNLWFTESGLHLSGGHFLYNIGRITPAGVVAEFEIPTTNSFPQGIARGTDGNLWFAERGVDQMGRITPTGVITEFPVPSAPAELNLVAAGPDGHIWFSQDNRGSLGRLDPAAPGQMQEIPIPSKAELSGFVDGQDGNLWFAEFYPRNWLGRVDLSASTAAAPIPALTWPAVALLALALFLAGARLLAKT